VYLEGKLIPTEFIKTSLFGIHTYEHNKNLGNSEEGDSVAVSLRSSNDSNNNTGGSSTGGSGTDNP